MILRQLQTLAFSYNEFVWWVGRVEDIEDPLKVGRVRVRVFGYYDAIPKDKLPWALCALPTTSTGLDGYGYSPPYLIENSTVFGFFADGHDALTPIIFASLGSNPTHSRPRYASGESDVNRLARGEPDSKMIPQKRSKLDVGVLKGFKGTWDEPVTRFAAKYPKNHVFEDGAGNIQEFDGTEGAERINTFHKDGSFDEFHPQGTKVERVMKDKYTIVHKDDYKHVKGDSSITIDGDGRIRITGDAYIHVEGNMNHYVKGDYKLRVDGNFDTEIRGGRTTTVLKNEIYQCGAKLRIEAMYRHDMVMGDYLIDACGNFDLVASKVFVSPDVIVKGDSPKCEPSELPPLFTGMIDEDAGPAKGKRLAPQCTTRKKLTAAEIAAGFKTCDPANHGPCWPYLCDNEPDP